MYQAIGIVRSKNLEKTASAKNSNVFEHRFNVALSECQTETFFIPVFIPLQ